MLLDPACLLYGSKYAEEISFFEISRLFAPQLLGYNVDRDGAGRDIILSTSRLRRPKAFEVL